MKLIRKNTLLLSMLIGTSLCSSNAMDEGINQPEEAPASIIRSQNLKYCTSIYTDLITKNKTLTELKDSLEKAKINFETTKGRLEIFLENKNLKSLYNQHLEELIEAKSNYEGLYDVLIIKFDKICSKEGLAHLCPQVVRQEIMPKEEVNPPLSVAINNPFKKAWALIDEHNEEKARELFGQLIGLHPFAAQGLFHCSTVKKEIEPALLGSIRVKLAVGDGTGLLGDLELLSGCQNMRDVNLLFRAAQYYRNQFNKSKNPIMVYNAILVGTMMPKCQEGTLLLNQIASLNIVANDNSQICYKFMNLCRNQEDIESLNVFLENNNFKGEWFSDKDRQFFAQQLEKMKNDKKFWLHRANLNVLQEISNSSNYSKEIRFLAAKIRFNSIENKNFDTYFDYYKTLKQFDDVERNKYIGILHKIADNNIQTHPDHLYKVATELGYFPDTLPMFMKAADAGCKEAMSAIEIHDIFLTDEYLESLALFFARHNSVKGIRNLHKKSNNNALLVILRELEGHSQSLGTLDITEEYLPLFDLEYEECKAKTMKLKEHISELEKMVGLINSAQTDFYDRKRLVVTYQYRPTIAEASATKKNIQEDLNTSKLSLEKNQNWLKMYNFKRQKLIESIPPENLFSLAKESLLIYHALNSRLGDGHKKTKILKDTYFELLRTAAQHSQEAINALKDIQTNGFNWPLYVLPSEAFRLEELEEFRGTDKPIKEHFMKQLRSNNPILISFNEQQGS